MYVYLDNDNCKKLLVNDVKNLKIVLKWRIGLEINHNMMKKM